MIFLLYNLLFLSYSGYHVKLYLGTLHLVLRDLPSFMRNIPGFLV